MLEYKAGLLATYRGVWGIFENSKCDISETGELLGVGVRVRGTSSNCPM